MIRLAVVGVGKMGLSHLAIANMHPGIEVAAVCESSGYVRGVLGKYTGLRTFGDYERMLARGRPRRGADRHPLEDAHAPWCDRRSSAACTCSARSRSRSIRTTARELAALAGGARRRHPGRLPQPVRRQLPRGQGAARRRGDRDGQQRPRRGVRAGRAEAQGRHLAQPQGPRAAAASTTTPPTRSTCSTGTWASPIGVGGTVLTSIFSREIDDEVFSTLFYGDGSTARVSVNWSDESCRKMTTRVSALGHRRADLRRPPGMPGLPARHGSDPARLRAGLERPLHDRADRAGLVLPARRGVQRPDRPLRRAGPRRERRRPERLRERRGDRQGDRDDGRRRGQGRRRRRRSRSRPRRRGASAASGCPRPKRHEAVAVRRLEPRRVSGDGPAAVRRQPVLRRQPHVGGEGASPGDALPVDRRGHRRPRLGLRRGDPHLHVHDARPDRRGLRSRPRDPERYRDFAFFPCMPYAHKYANAVTENGMLGAVQALPPRRGAARRDAARRDLDGDARTSRADHAARSTPR